MKNIDLASFFKIIQYDWQKDQEKIKDICYLTKTRKDPTKTTFNLDWGMEQPFLIKAITEFYKANSFFEIGTGRGTACYAVALNPEIQKITTIDIIPFNKKQKTAIGYQEVVASNQDLYEQLTLPEKTKINFNLRNDPLEPRPYDVAFVDGNHTEPEIIKEDFHVAKFFLKENGIFLFDDYDPNKFKVKEVVDQISPNYNTLLIEFRGHLFGNREKEKESGLVLMTQQPISFC